MTEEAVAGAEAPAETEVAVSPDPGAGPAQAETNGFDEQFQSMEDRILSKIDERLTPTEAAAEPGSLGQQLAGEQNFEGLSDEEYAQLQAEYAEEEDPNDPYAGMDPQEALAAYVEDQVNERVAPLEEKITQAQINESIREVNAVAEKYPDLQTDPEIQGAVMQKLEAVAQRTGNRDVFLDPELVEIVYKSVKADATADSEVPAEAAAAREATLETRTGPSNQGSADPGDAYRQGLLQQGKKSAFT